MLSQCEFNRTVSDQLAIELHRHVLIACNPQPLRLKIFHFGQANVGAEKYLLQIFNDLKITDLFEGHYVHQTVVEHCVFEKREGTAIAATVPDQHERSFVDRRVRRFDEKPRWPAS